MFFIIFGLAFLFSGIVVAFTGELEKDLQSQLYNKESIERNKIENTKTEDFFVYYDILFQKGFTKKQTFKGDEEIWYLSDREFFQDLDNFNTKESAYKYNEKRKTYTDGKQHIDTDSKTQRKQQERHLVPWKLRATCNTLGGVGEYKIEHLVWIELPYGIDKPQMPPMYTYITCE